MKTRVKIKVLRTTAPLQPLPQPPHETTIVFLLLLFANLLRVRIDAGMSLPPAIRLGGTQYTPSNLN